MKFIIMFTVVACLYGCSDDPTRPEAPPLPPQVTVQRFTVAQGLPSNEVFDILVDSKGRTWISTDGGLWMKEGSTVSVFDDFDGIPNRKCRGLTEHNGKIFVGTWGGGIAAADSMAIYDDSTSWEKVTKKDGLVSNFVFDLASDAATNEVWIGTTAGLNRYVDNGAFPISSRVSNQTFRLGGNGLLVSGVTIVRPPPTFSREIWLSKLDGGITVVRGGSTHYTTANSGLPHPEVREVAYDPATGLYWAGFATVGTATVDVANSTWRYFTRENQHLSDLVHSVAVNTAPSGGTVGNPQGTVWIGTQEGLIRRQPNGTVTNYPSNSGLPALRVRKVYVDDDGFVWLGFIEGGAAKVNTAGN